MVFTKDNLWITSDQRRFNFTFILNVLGLFFKWLTGVFSPPFQSFIP
jgi:hypothetical protein